MPRFLPLFPLQMVVFPGALVPLHIFEERYREMVSEAEARGTEFGIVRTMARDEESGIAATGCTVTVESVVKRYPDGRFDVLTRGRRRFQIESLDDEKSYLRGTVEYFDDETSEQIPDDLLNRAMEAHKRLVGEIGTGESPPALEPKSADLSFHLAADIEDLDFRSLMQQSRSEPARLRLFTQFVDDYIQRHQYTAYMQKKAPTNGSGHKRVLPET